MSYVFTPPTAPARPLHTNNPQHPAWSLFRHYRPHEAGANVWIVEGVVTTRQPAGDLATDDREFLGSHIYTVTDAEAALLTAAGYGTNLTEL
jgi:hypothetical protein